MRVNAVLLYRRHVLVVDGVKGKLTNRNLPGSKDICRMNDLLLCFLGSSLHHQLRRVRIEHYWRLLHYYDDPANVDVIL